MASEKEISPQLDGGDIQVSKDATTGGVVNIDGDEEFSKRDRTVIEHARAAAAKEQNMTLLQGIKLYPKAIAWSMIISTCIVMEGYDISLVNNFCTSPLREP
jgi:SP family general alpha glucoside:H+ symporter-like MFS transporter